MARAGFVSDEQRKAVFANKKKSKAVNQVQKTQAKKNQTKRTQKATRIESLSKTPINRVPKKETKSTTKTLAKDPLLNSKKNKMLWAVRKAKERYPQKGWQQPLRWAKSAGCPEASPSLENAYQAARNGEFEVALQAISKCKLPDSKPIRKASKFEMRR